MKKTSRRSETLGWFLWQFLLAAGILGLVLSLILPDRHFSQTENRVLQEFPDLSSPANDELASWFSDQFAGRDTFFKIGYIAKRLTGQSEINDVYIGKGLLAQNPAKPNPDHSDQMCAAIQNFQARTGLPATVEIVPTSADINKSKLPAFADVPDIDAYLASLPEKLGSVTFVNPTQTLKDHANEYLYYRTDHHWTSRGAYYGYTDLAAAKGWAGTNEDEYEVMKAASGFQGTLASKTGDPFLRDDVDLWVKKDLPEYVMTRDGKKSRTMYDSEALGKKDKYEVFTGANVGEVTFEMDNDSGIRLLVFKDSYANSMLQFLIPQCRSITVIDPRYYSGNLDTLLKSGMFTEVLFLYNYQTWMTDRSLTGVIGS